MIRSNDKVVFGLQQLSCMMPFILVIDEEANIIWASDAVTRRFEKVLGMNVSQLITFTKPHAACVIDSLSARLGQWCTFALLGADSEIPLAGRWFADGPEFIFLAIPNPGSTEELGRFAFEDFPENDYLIDLLMTRDENARSLEEASSAAKALKQRTREVEEARSQLDRKLHESNEQRRAILTMMEETKKAEQKFRASEERLRIILDTIHAGIVLVDIETHRIIDVNTAAVKMIGLRKDKIIGSVCHKFICPAEKGKCPITDLSQKVDNSERALLTSNGQEIPILKTVAVIALDGRDCLLESFVDLTKQKDAEQALKETHQRLIQASHKAGMAEVATNVLHNVGNVLNSINISTQFAYETLLNSKAENLKKVAELVSAHTNDLDQFLTQDERGKHIPLYLNEVAGIIVNEQETIIEKLRTLAKNVEHVKHIIKAQQEYTRAGGVEQLTSINEVIEDAIEINRADLRKDEVDITLELAEMPDVYMDKQSVLQILVNLITNARHALSENDSQKKSLTIRCLRHEKERLRIEVADNGIGIIKTNLTKIFRFGFTTKRHGNGFGLHSGALAAGELGGKLMAHSDGPGQGATFILELPYHSFAQTAKGEEKPPVNPMTSS